MALGDEWTEDERRQYAEQIRAHESREAEIISEGEAMLENRWGLPIASVDARHFADFEVRTNPVTGEKTDEWVEERPWGAPVEAVGEREETLNELEQQVEESRNRDEDGRPRPDA